MNDDLTQKLAGITLAPWIQKASALRGVPRKTGGNQFRHAFSTLGILIDYQKIDAVLLKAAIIHDLFEDSKKINIEFLKNEFTTIDDDGEAVYALAQEVTQDKKVYRDKGLFLKKILEEGSVNAKILKCADRISNLTDLNHDIFNRHDMLKTLEDTRKYILPMARQVDDNMYTELNDLIRHREAILKFKVQILHLLERK